MVIAVVTVIELLVACSIGFAAVAYVTQIILDATGRSRTSKTLRQENEDLIRRNKELGHEIGILRREVDRLEGELRSVRLLVDDLGKRDQKAVLEALALHEVEANKRWDGTIRVLAEIRDALTKETP